MTNVVIGPSELDTLPSGLIDATQDACRRMGLIPSDPETILWSSDRAAGCARQIGRRLHDALPAVLTEPIDDLRHLPAEWTSPQACVWIPASHDPELPWELVVADGADRMPWGLEERIGVAYRIRWNEPVRPELSLQGPLNIIVASCMPVGIPSANVDAQRVVLARTVGGLPPAWQTCHAWHENPSFDTLRAAVSDGTTLLHIIAHGRPGEVLWHDAGRPHWLTAHAFCRELAGTDLALASFCVCDSATSRNRQMPSLADAAGRSFANATVGMRGLLADASAAAYLQGLLSPLASGAARVDRMVSNARRTIAARDSSQHWTRPAMFIRDGMLRFQLVPSVVEPEMGSPSTGPHCLVIGAERVRLGKRPISVGRSTAADVVIVDPDIAPFQIVVDTSLEPPEVRDQTGQGIRVNGRDVARSRLADGDRLSFGAVTLTFQSESAVGG